MDWANTAWDDKRYEYSCYIYRTYIDNKILFNRLSLRERNHIELRLEDYRNGCRLRELAKDNYFYYNDYDMALEYAERALTFIETDDMTQLRNKIKELNNYIEQLNSAIEQKYWNIAEELTTEIEKICPGNEHAKRYLIIIKLIRDIETTNEQIKLFEYNEKNFDCALKYCEFAKKVDKRLDLVKKSGFLNDETLSEYVCQIAGINNTLIGSIFKKIEKDKINIMFHKLRKCEFGNAKLVIVSLLRTMAENDLSWVVLKNEEVYPIVIDCIGIIGLTDEEMISKAALDPSGYIEETEQWNIRKKKEIDDCFKTKDWEKAAKIVDYAQKYFCFNDEYNNIMQVIQKNKNKVEAIRKEIEKLVRSKLKCHRKQILYLYNLIQKQSLVDLFNDKERLAANQILKSNLRRLIWTTMIGTIFLGIIVGTTAGYFWRI